MKIADFLFPMLRTSLADQRIVLLSGMRRGEKTTTLGWLLDRGPSMEKIFQNMKIELFSKPIKF